MHQIKENTSSEMIKFAILRFSSIGDIILCSPVIRNLRRTFPNAQIHFVSKKKFAFLLEENPYLDKVHSLESSTKALIEELKQEQFDYIIDLHNNLRTSRIKRSLKCPDFTFNKHNIAKYLLVHFKINKMPKQHIVDRYMDTLSVFDVENDQKGLDVFLKSNLEERPYPHYIAVVIGGTYFTKQIPENLIIELINRSQHNYVLLGGPEDVDKSERIMQAADKGHCKNFCGSISLADSSEIIRLSDLVISSDTGLMHIAAAHKKAIISLWGNTVPELGMTAYKANEHSIVLEDKELKCRPCSKIGYQSCPKKHFKCMNNISCSDLINSIENILSKL